MGYTHYWSFKKPKRGKMREAEKKYAAAIKDCATLIRSYYIANGELSGYSAHTKPGKYDGILFNGKGDLAHEDFSLRATFKEASTACHSDCYNFNFCKTARKPYDEVVVACLLILKRHLGDLIEISSDGYLDDWYDGRELARRYFKDKTLQVPASIGVNNYAVINKK
jgi:hypothetical protein